MTSMLIPAHQNPTHFDTGDQAWSQTEDASRPVFAVRPHATFLGATTLTFIKPRLRTVLRPVVARLARIGVTANQVTTFSLIGSVAVGAMLCTFPNDPMWFTILRVWLVIRTLCASIDGTLAVEFGQKSRLGGFLNEAGDIISDIALFSPLVFVPPFSTATIVLLIALIVLTEAAGIVGPLLGSVRRLEGPLGKSDRSIILAVISWVVVVHGKLPEGALFLIPVLSLGLVVTIWNRIRFALADSNRNAERQTLGRLPISSRKPSVCPLLPTRHHSLLRLLPR